MVDHKASSMMTRHLHCSFHFIKLPLIFVFNFTGTKQAIFGHNKLLGGEEGEYFSVLE